MAISTNLSVPPCCIIVMAGRGLTGANSVRRAPLGTLLPPRAIPAKAGTQLYRYYAKLALGPRFRGDDANFVASLRRAYDDRVVKLAPMERGPLGHDEGVRA